jgi:hypothetical protein
MTRLGPTCLWPWQLSWPHALCLPVLEMGACAYISATTASILTA